MMNMYATCMMALVLRCILPLQLMQERSELSRTADQTGSGAAAAHHRIFAVLVYDWWLSTTAELQALPFETARPGPAEAGSFERQLHTEGKEMRRYTVIRTA